MVKGVDREERMIWEELGKEGEYNQNALNKILQELMKRLLTQLEKGTGKYLGVGTHTLQIHHCLWQCVICVTVPWAGWVLPRAVDLCMVWKQAK